MKKKNVTTNKYDTVACEDIYSVACNKAIMGKNRVCRQVRCLWRKLINLLLLECQLCGSASLCCTGTAEAEGGGANGSFFKGQVFSPKQHTAQPHWWQLLQHSYSLKKGQDGYMLLTSTSTLLLIRERSSTFQIAAHLHFLSFWHIPGVQHSL